MKQVLNKFGKKWRLPSYFSLLAKFWLIQSGIFAPIRAPPGRFDNSEPLWILLLLHTLPSIIAFKLLYALLYQCYAEISSLSYRLSVYFRSRSIIRFGSYQRHWCWNVWRKMTSKTDVMTSKRHSYIMHESRSCTCQSHGNSCRVCKNILSLVLNTVVD